MPVFMPRRNQADRDREMRSVQYLSDLQARARRLRSERGEDASPSPSASEHDEDTEDQVALADANEFVLPSLEKVVRRPNSPGAMQFAKEDDGGLDDMHSSGLLTAKQVSPELIKRTTANRPFVTELDSGDEEDGTEPILEELSVQRNLGWVSLDSSPSEYSGRQICATSFLFLFLFMDQCMLAIVVEDIDSGAKSVD